MAGNLNANLNFGNLPPPPPPPVLTRQVANVTNAEIRNPIHAPNNKKMPPFRNLTELNQYRKIFHNSKYVVNPNPTLTGSGGKRKSRKQRKQSRKQRKQSRKQRK